MKLLIVEDEQVTRENLKSMLDFQRLGFTEVMIASNGEDGLKKALRNKPDVILTDIRMPRMDGITLAENIRKQLPKCQVIFLSAYAELEYYKAAIRLKTVSYVEKPVAPAELERVLLDAARECRQNDMLERVQSREKLMKRKPLASKMTFPNQKEEVSGLLEELAAEQDPALLEFGYVTTLLLSFRRPTEEESLLVELSDWVESKGQMLLYTRNKEDCYVLQILTREAMERFLTLVEERLCRDVGEEREWYLSVGDTVTIGRSYQSYQTAVIGMQKCFFEPYGYVAYSRKAETDGALGADCSKERREILTAIEKFSLEEIRELETALFRNLLRQKNMFSGKIRGMYCDFFEAVFRESEQRQIPSGDLEEYRQLIRKGEVDRLNCMELHESFSRLLQTAAACMEAQREEYSLILMIKKYVEDNYGNPQFSLMDVSEYVHLSVSYICVIFKQQTGITINQYLTDVRMEKARKYLTGTRYSLGEISNMIGYQNSSYFGRIFKKIYKITPMEYREREGKMHD